MDKKARKRYTTVSIDAQIMDWLEGEIREKRFSSISHAVEYSLYLLMKKEKKV